MNEEDRERIIEALQRALFYVKSNDTPWEIVKDHAMDVVSIIDQAGQ